MINMIPLASIIDWIKAPFGYLLQGSYELTHSYAVAIIIFALVIRIVLLPFSIKQQKGMVKQAKLRPKEMEIRNKYKGRTDKKTQEKLNQEIMDLYQREHYSPFSGCLPLLIQLPVILILFYVVTAPISYIVPAVNKSDVYFTVNYTEDYVPNAVDKYVNGKLSLNFEEDFEKNARFSIRDGYIYDQNGERIGTASGISVDSLTDKHEEIRKGAIKAAINEWFPSEDGKAKSYSEIVFIQDYKNASDEERAALNAAIPNAEELADFNCNLFGFIDLLGFPKFFNWLLILPVLSGITAFLQTMLTKKLNGAAQPQEQNDATKSLKIMDYAMPLFNVYITYIVPASVGFYWLMSNVIMIGQNFLLAKLIPIPKLEELMEEDKQNKKAQKKAKKNGASYTVSEDEFTVVEESKNGALGDFDFGELKDDKKDE